MWSRQTGKTFAATLEIVRDVLAARTRGEASPWLILSRGERQAREAMRAGVRRHALAFGLASARRASLREYDLRAGGRVRSALEWDAGGGNLVTALPANPDTARGYSRNVYLDEFALHRDSREVWAALYPQRHAGLAHPRHLDSARRTREVPRIDDHRARLVAPCGDHPRRGGGRPSGGPGSAAPRPRRPGIVAPRI